MPINKFTTLLDLARQSKIITGETATFDGKIEVGIPFSGYPTGVNTATTVSLGVISSENAVFSGNTGTTLFDVSNILSPNYNVLFSGYSATTWTNPLFSGTTSGLTLPITIFSANTQIVGPYWTLTQTGMTGDYNIGTQYTGYSVTYSFFNVADISTTTATTLYSGFTTATQENFSAGTLDYKGPLDYLSTKEDATVDGRLTTNKLSITNGASLGTIGYILTQVSENGDAEWQLLTTAATNTYVTGGTLNTTDLILGLNDGSTTSPINLSTLSGNTLAQTLVGGNTTGGENIITSNSDVIKAASGGSQLNLRVGSDSVFDLTTDNGAYGEAWVYGDTTYSQLGWGGKSMFESIDKVVTMKTVGGVDGSGIWMDINTVGVSALAIPYVANFKVAYNNTVNVSNHTNGTANAVFINSGLIFQETIFNSGVTQSVAVGGIDITVKTDNTAYANQIALQPSGNLFDGLLVPPTLTADRTYTFQDGSGTVAFLSDISSFTGNTSASCITDLYITNLYGCSPITVHDNIQYSGSSATGTSSTALGFQTVASGDYSYSQGHTTIASGQSSHAEGQLTIAGFISHAEGSGTTASGSLSHSEGFGTIASGANSHAEGWLTLASGVSSHAEGRGSLASGLASHSEGVGTTASGANSHAEGQGTIASGTSSHVEGSETIASGANSHAEGNLTIASGTSSHAEGLSTTASTVYSHAEGWLTLASGISSHAEGNLTIASGTYSHAEGQGTIASGNGSHSEGEGSVASNDFSHAEGSGTASGVFSHAEGASTLASGTQSHAQNSNTIASGNNSHGGGSGTIASGRTAFTHFTITGTTSGVYGDYSAILGGVDNNINNSGNSSAILGGNLNVIDTNVSRSVILGGSGITGTTNDTVFVPNLNINTSFTPSGSSDTTGSIGNITWDDDFIYVKTNVGWGRSQLIAF